MIHVIFWCHCEDGTSQPMGTTIVALWIILKTQERVANSYFVRVMLFFKDKKKIIVVSGVNYQLRPRMSTCIYERQTHIKWASILNEIHTWSLTSIGTVSSTTNSTSTTARMNPKVALTLLMVVVSAIGGVHGVSYYYQFYVKHGFAHFSYTHSHLTWNLEAILFFPRQNLQAISLLIIGLFGKLLIHSINLLKYIYIWFMIGILTSHDVSFMLLMFNY